jgi:hypothetical protein
VDGKPGGELGDTELIRGIVIDKVIVLSNYSLWLFLLYVSCVSVIIVCNIRKRIQSHVK